VVLLVLAIGAAAVRARRRWQRIELELETVAVR
jgi:hypothetical protein